VSANEYLVANLKEVAEAHDMDLVYSLQELCTDNGAMIAWMGWELMNAQQDVDIRGLKVQGLKSIPLGNYVDEVLIPHASQLKKVGNSKHTRSYELTHTKGTIVD